MTTIKADDMEKAQEVALQALYANLIMLSMNEKLPTNDRLEAAFKAGVIKPILHHESCAMADAECMNIINAGTLVEKYKTPGLPSLEPVLA